MNLITSEKFIEHAKNMVKKEIYNNYPIDFGTEVDVNVVAQSKILQNHKAFITTDFQYGLYYEVIYDGNKDIFYLDIYNRKTETHEKGE